MRILEALESKGCRLPLVKAEAELAEKLVAITRQVRFSWLDLIPLGQSLFNSYFRLFFGIHNYFNSKFFQLKGSGAELSRRVQTLLAQSRAQSGLGSSLFLPGSTKVHDQSLSDLHEVRSEIFYVHQI